MGCSNSKGAKHTHDDIDRVYKALEYLIKRQNFATKKSREALAEFEMLAAVDDDDLKADVVKTLLSRGFAELFLRIFQSLQAGGPVNTRRSLRKYDESQREENFKFITDIGLDFTDISIEEHTNISLELIQNGSVKAILEELRYFDPTQTQYRGIIATMLMTLDNCAACSADGLVRIAYRKANAVEILQKYLQSGEILFKTVSLFILSRIISEEESNQLAAAEGCISSLVQLTKKACQSEDKEVYFETFGEDNIGYGLWRLINAIDRLSTNTANQQMLVQHGIVNVIIEILQPYYMQDPGFPQTVMEILWKLAFVDSLRDIIISELTESNALQFVKDLQKSDNIGLCNASIGLLWKLDVIDIHTDVKQAEGNQQFELLSCNSLIASSEISDDDSSPSEDNPKASASIPTSEDPIEDNPEESPLPTANEDAQHTEVEAIESPHPATPPNEGLTEDRHGESPLSAAKDGPTAEDKAIESPHPPTSSNEDNPKAEEISQIAGSPSTTVNEDLQQKEIEPNELPPSTTSEDVQKTEDHVPPPLPLTNKDDSKEILTGKVMISYQWDVQERAIAVRDKLTANGCKVWMDIDEMRGNYLIKMANAVETSTVILMCMSQKYKDSVNCRQEAMYAFEKQKAIIPLIMEDGFTADGWLGLLASGRMYYPAHCDEILASGITGLWRDIKEHLIS